MPRLELVLRNPAAPSRLERCYSTAGDVCSSFPLDGTAATCTSVVDLNSDTCVYTAADAGALPPVVEGCASRAGGQCAGVVLDGSPGTCTGVADGASRACVHEAPVTPLDKRYAECVDINVQRRTLRFRFYVQPGDYTTDLRYVSVAALELNGGAVLDGNSKAASLALPDPDNGAADQVVGTGALNLNNEVLINDEVPVVTNFSCPLPNNGRYGAGEILDFYIQTSLPVVVTGTPRVQLSILSITPDLYTRWAMYIGVVPNSNKQTLLFQYVVQSNDTTTGTTLDNRLNFVADGAPGGRGTIDLNGGTATIKRLATVPTTVLDMDLESVALTELTLAKNHKIILDTTAPKIDAKIGITSPKPGGVTYTSGETVEIDIPFTEPVVVYGNPQLVMESGVADRPAVYSGIGSGTRVLKFIYTAANPDVTPDLNYLNDDALDMNQGYIRRYVSRGDPTTDANSDLKACTDGGSALSDNLLQFNNGNIAIDASQLFVSAVTFDTTVLQSLTPTGLLAPPALNTLIKDEYADILVTWTGDVIVDTLGGTPSIELESGDVDREAKYISGSGTDTLRFRYYVTVGDSTETGLDYKKRAGMGLKNKWERVGDGNGRDGKIIQYGSIRRASSNPDLDVDIILPTPGALAATAVIVPDTTAAENTYIVSITTDTKPGSYGVNEIMNIHVHFSDEVYLPGFMPRVLLNAKPGKTGITDAAYAKYTEGGYTKRLSFVYIVEAGDTTPELNIIDQFSLLNDYLTGYGPIKNLNMMSTAGTLLAPGVGDMQILTSLTTAGLGVDVLRLYPEGIEIDTTAPVVTSVRCENGTSTANGGAYVVGDRLHIIVSYNLEIFVDPPADKVPDKTPQLLLETGVNDRKAKYIGPGPGDNRFEATFEYVVEEYDFTEDLRYYSTTSLDLNADQATIKRLATTPTTNAVLTLPIPVSLRSDQQVIRVNGDSMNYRPYVVNVTTSKANGQYGGGEVIELNITFNKHVSVNCNRDALKVCQNTPFVMLELGKVDRKAYWVRGGDVDPRTSSGAGSEVVTFRYTVQKGDYSTDLDYVDRNSLRVNGGSIKQTASTPTTPANLTLAYSGRAGSLGGNSAIEIDGLTPYITKVWSDASNECQYWLAGKCQRGYRVLGEETKVYIRFSSSVTISTPTPEGNRDPLVALPPAVVPFLKLHLGANHDFWRPCPYIEGNNTNTLAFLYTVQTGDNTTDLDYVDSASFVLPKGSSGLAKDDVRIRRTSAYPFIDADIWLNPPGGNIFGKVARPLAVGRVKYRDLLVDKRGKGYRIYFSTPTGEGLYASSSFDVIYSSEYEVMAKDRSRGDRFGCSASVHDDTSVIGAYKAHRPTHEVQVVRITGQSTTSEYVMQNNVRVAPNLDSAFVPEIQMLQVSAVHRNEVMTVTTVASPSTKIGGFFTLDCAGLGPSRPIASSATPSQMEALMNMDMPDLGGVKVTRSTDTFCACEGAYTWSITFLHLPAPVQIETTIRVTFDTSAFPTVYKGSAISAVEWRTTVLTDDVIKVCDGMGWGGI